MVINMLGFPLSTEFNKRVPKQKFYEKTDVSSAMKRIFAEKVRLIYWRNKLAPTTLNLAAGESVTEIEVFKIKLNVPEPDETILRLIDKEISYHILFILTYEGKAQAWMGYKEVAGSTFKVNRYYHTDWMEEEKLRFSIDGLNMDAVYESLVRQIAGEILQPQRGESLKESVARDERRRQLEKQIATLEEKIRKEKQLNRRIEINAEIKQLKNEKGKMQVTRCPSIE